MAYIFPQYRKQKSGLSITILKKVEARMSELERYRAALEYLANPENYLTFYQSEAKRREWIRLKDESQTPQAIAKKALDNE